MVERVVYGAHADNPQPLAESDPIRPEAGFPIAGQLAELERLVLGFDGQDGPVVLRSAPVWACRPGGPCSAAGWPRRSCWASAARTR